MTDRESTLLNLPTGCYIDGHHGIYAIVSLVDLVDGMVDPINLPSDWFDIPLIVSQSLYGDPDASVTLSDGTEVTTETAHDIVSDLYGELTDLLPTTPTTEWEWRDGELFLSPITDDKYLSLARARYAFPGGYEMFFITDDGGTLCSPCVVKEWDDEIERTWEGSGWFIVGADHEGNLDDPVTCDNCSRIIGEDYGDGS